MADSNRPDERAAKAAAWRAFIDSNGESNDPIEMLVFGAGWEAGRAFQHQEHARIGRELSGVDMRLADRAVIVELADCSHAPPCSAVQQCATRSADERRAVQAIHDEERALRLEMLQVMRQVLDDLERQDEDSALVALRAALSPPAPPSAEIIVHGARQEAPAPYDVSQPFDADVLMGGFTETTIEHVVEPDSALGRAMAEARAAWAAPDYQPIDPDTFTVTPIPVDPDEEHGG